MRDSYNDLREFADASTEWSLRRRIRKVHENRIDIWLLTLAVPGVALLIYFCTLPFPIESWWIGILAVILILPYLTRRIS